MLSNMPRINFKPKRKKKKSEEASPKEQKGKLRPTLIKDNV